MKRRRGEIWRAARCELHEGRANRPGAGRRSRGVRPTAEEITLTRIFRSTITAAMLAAALLMLMPRPAYAACMNDTSDLDDVLARYERKSFLCSAKSTTDVSASKREIRVSCSKSSGTSGLRRYLITATVDRATGCDVVEAVSEKPIRNTSPRGFCRPGGPCNHGDYARP